MPAQHTEPAPDPAELLPHFSMWDPEHEQIKWGVFEYARSACPVAHTDGDGGRQYIVTRYEDVKRVLHDPGTFSSKGVAPRPSPVCLNPLDSDPPYQVELRKILNPLFTRGFLMRFEADLRKNAIELIGTFRDARRCEFIRDFAGPFVANALSTVVFHESDPEKMRAITDVVVKVALEGTDEEYLKLAMLAAQYIQDRQDHPIERTDVLNAISTATVEDGRPLTDLERMGVVIVLFLGGLDTTRGAMGSIAYYLATQPGIEARLRDPDWVRQDLDEFVRLASPVGCLGRTATTDVELGGIQIKAGEQVLVRFDSANRDESQFEDASRLRFDIRRGGNVGFGLGVHRCLGSHFARIQLAVAFEELLARVTNVRLANPDSEIRWAPGIANGPERLDIAFDLLG